MLCSLPEALAILDAHWQCLTNSEQRYWIFENLYDLGSRSLGLLCDSLEMNPAQASIQILTQISSDPALAVLLYDDLVYGYTGFVWLHLKLALTSEQLEQLFHQECLRRWERTADQFREWYDDRDAKQEYDDIGPVEPYDSDLNFLERLRSILEEPLDVVIQITRPPVRILDAGKAAFVGQILGHDQTEEDDATAREAYRTMIQTLGEA